MEHFDEKYIVHRIKDHCERMSIAPSTFTKMALNDPNFLDSFENGKRKSITLRTARKILEKIAENENNLINQ